ncbi:MAG: HYR domain-containing protein, partial [Bacteroidales bacterium]|nr:HYR domain-containing protein [Bacteroidales bacterium]
SIRIFTPTAINRTGSDDYHFDYYFTSESGVIQIHFDELVLNDYGIRMELEDEATDIEYVEYEAGIYHDVTVTSLRNHLHMQFSREVGRTFSFDATVINIATSNEVLSKMERADVIMKVASATANVTATNDTVCYGSPALLTASSSDPAFPQIYTWYDSDVNEILLSDTITSGVSSLYIPGQLGAATYYVFMNNENNPCPLTVVDRHDNFREYLFTEEMNNATLFVGAVDSLVLYDNGGKDGDYSIVVDENTHFNIIKLQTYPGSIIHVEIPTLETDEEYSFFAIAEPDENGNLDFEDDDNVILLTGQMSDFSYNSQTNILYVGWIYYGTDQASTPSGYEVVLTSIMHPENQLTKAKVEMSNLPNMNTLALTADPNETTICQGDDVELTATSTLTDQPQYFVWYNSDFTSVLAADTVQLGNEGHATISDLTQDTLIYVAVGTDEMCPAYPMDHKILVQELYLTAPVSGDTTILSLIDSVLFYDEGGPSNNYNSENVIWYHTFKASNPDAHVIIHFKDINLDTKCSSDNWLVVVQGPLDFEDRDNNDFLHEPFQGTHSDVTLVSDGDSLTVVWGSKCWDSQRRGWEAYVFTDETVNVGMDAFDTTEVTVNPSYHYTVYDSVCASTTQLYDVDKFHGIDISVPGDYTIDSVYSTNLGCDSIYSLQLHVRSNPVIGDNATVTDVACNGGSTGIIDMSTATTTGGEAPFTYTLFQNGTKVSSFSDLIAGTYKVVAKDVHGCYSDSTTIDIDEPDTLHVVNCPTVSATYQVLPGETFVTVELDDPTFAPALNNARVTERQGKADNNLYSVGTYTITYVVENDCNEEDTCSVTFTVENADDVPPCIGCDSTATDPTDPNAGVNCASIGNQNVQPNSGTTYVHGDNSWNITATDDNVEVTLTYKLFGATTAVT